MARVDNSVKKYDDKEDKDIKMVANYKTTVIDKYLFCFLIMLFGVTVALLLLSINDYKKSKSDFLNSENVIEIKNNKDNILIVNSLDIDEFLKNDMFQNGEDYKVERINSIRLKSEKNGEDSVVHYNIKYNIVENGFARADKGSLSDIYVRFAYSYDNKEWNYINNAISIQESNILPLIGNHYDIAGIKDTLKVSSKNELLVNDGEEKTVYWKCETIFKNNYKTNNIKFKSNFVIEYVQID